MTRQRPTIWKPRYPTRSMRERAWANADLARERAREAFRAPVASRPAAATLPLASIDVEATHDVLVVGAGCAGMRAAIEAHDAGAERRRHLEASSDPQPLRRGRGRDQRRARERGRGLAGDAHVRHGQGLRLHRRPGRDRDLLPRGARRHLPARALGRRLLAARGRQARTAPVRRRRARRARSSPPTSPATC